MPDGRHPMRRVLALIAFLFPSWALAAEAASPEAVEQELRACLLDSNRNATCFQSTLAKYLPPKNEEVAKVATQIDELMKKWLASDKVFAVHSINPVKTGDLFERGFPPGRFLRGPCRSSIFDHSPTR